MSTKQPVLGGGELLYRNVRPLYNPPMQTNMSKTDGFVGACRKAAEYGLVSCSSGNLSWRVAPNTAMLSGSGVWMADMKPEDVACCAIDTGQQFNDIVPTCEHVFHLGILRNRPRVNVVLHFQSPYATAIACGQREGIDFNMTIEVPVYIGEPATVPYLPPGSEELAQAVVDAFKDPKTHLAILKNHGLVSVGTDFDDAIQNAVFFEMACRIILTNPDAKPLDTEAVKRLRAEGAKA